VRHIDGTLRVLLLLLLLLLVLLLLLLLLIPCLTLLCFHLPTGHIPGQAPAHARVKEGTTDGHDR
jgi:hypothetical protein